MQSVQTYPAWQHLSAAAPARAGTIAYLRALTLVVWFGSLVVNYWWRQEWDWHRQFSEQDVNIRSQYMIGFITVLAGHLTLGASAWFNAPFRALSTLPGKLFTVFCFLAFIVSPFSASMNTSGVYAAATWLTFLLCILYWSSDYYVVRRVVVFGGLFLFAWLLALLVRLGMPQGIGTAIGGINRNTTSAVAMAAMICCTLSASRTIRWGGIAGCAFFALLVNSRGTTLALGVYLAVYYTLHKGSLQAAWHAALGLFLVITVLLASTFAQQLLFEDVMRLKDPGRGLGGGLTGRVETWQRGLETFWKSPLIGHGFRANVSGEQEGLWAHGGYITLLIETGLIGTLLAVSFVVCEALRRMKRAGQLRNAAAAAIVGIDRQESLRLNAVACATMATMLTYWIYEPLYLNLGTVMSVCFFLMLAAPEFVDDRRAMFPASRTSGVPGPNLSGRLYG
jgi:O-antigen ligase